ncbi:MAG: hypothetical protein A3I43_01305 [Omnitrophica WOR_2 bacterium RIFCSPLOWO2_02_FULL_50_19]|nr:MAG: hypothetical protein A3I43_01305 [Omnitrophica WOR_2 bacterium RIFCSPLOWO2_02_FULL_50_19]
MKSMTTILGYVYWPLLYFAVYLPVIVPRLDQWHHIPSWFTWSVLLGFVVVLGALGVKTSHKAIALHAFGIACFLQGFIFAMSRLNMPSFLKSYEAGFLPDAILPIFIVATIIAVLAEVGHSVVILKGRASNNRMHRTVANAPTGDA